MHNEAQLTMWNFDKPLSHLEILNAFTLPGEWLSRRSVAMALKRSKSPRLVLMLTDLVATGFLDMKLVGLPNQVDMYAYRLTERGMDAILHDDLPLSSVLEK